MPDESDLLFAGLKVLDVGTWIAGPVSATILADFGASVIKVEQPGVGDPYRQMVAAAPINYAWLLDARNKRGISLNLKSEEGRDILMRLVRECDVYVTNQPPPMRRQLRLTYEDLAPLNERMIYASLTAYGEVGPDSDREGFDGVAYWARSGLMDLVRSPGAVPGMSTPGMGDHPTAVALYAAIVTALLRRERTGKGGKVHTSLLANGLWSNSCVAQGAFTGADIIAARRNQPPIISPNRTLYETSDERLLQLYMVRTQAELDALLIAAGATEILMDPRFSEPETRMEHIVEFIEALQLMFVTRTAAEWMATFRAANVPVSLVAQIEDLPYDEQILAIGAVEAPRDPRVPSPLVINHPVNVEGLARTGILHAPEIGEHTDEILAEMGFGGEEISGLRARGVI